MKETALIRHLPDQVALGGELCLFSVSRQQIRNQIRPKSAGAMIPICLGTVVGLSNSTFFALIFNSKTAVPAAVITAFLPFTSVNSKESSIRL